jgi:O-antigen/teichoic acid export membrane protein
MALLRRFGGTVTAYGISSVSTLALTLIVARSLPKSEVALLTLVLATGALAAAFGTGIDAAGARTAVRSGGRGLAPLFLRASRLRLGCLAVSIVPLAGYLFDASGSLGADTAMRTLAISSFAVYATGACAAYLLCYEPQAAGDTVRQAKVQAAFALPVLLASVVATLAHGGEAGLLVAMAAGSLPVIAWLGWKIGRSRVRARLSHPHLPGFHALAAALTIGTVAFAIFQRLDLLWVGATRTSSEVAEYAVANRVVSGFSLLTATLVIVGLPTVGAASTRSDALKALGRLRVPLVGVLALVALGVVVSPVLVPLVFGGDYSKAGLLASVLLLQYVPLLSYSLINIPLPFICGRRTVVVQGIVLLGVEALWLAVFRRADLTVIAIAPLAGQSAAAAFTWFQFSRAVDAGALVVPEARA